MEQADADTNTASCPPTTTDGQADTNTASRPPTTTGGQAEDGDETNTATNATHEHSPRSTRQGSEARGGGGQTEGDGGSMLSPREQAAVKASNRQKQLAAIYGAPVAGAASGMARNGTRPKLRGLYNNAGFDREPGDDVGTAPADSGRDGDGHGAPSAVAPSQNTGSAGAVVAAGTHHAQQAQEAENSNDEFEYERAGVGDAHTDAALAEQLQPAGGGDGQDDLQLGSGVPMQLQAAAAEGGEGGTASKRPQPQGGRIDAGAAGNLLDMLDDL
jgi:hypothetical protein